MARPARPLSSALAACPAARTRPPVRRAAWPLGFLACLALSAIAGGTPAVGKPLPRALAEAPPVFGGANPVPVGDSPARGSANAAVTIVTFQDYQCPFCARLDATLTALEQAYPGKVRLVVKQLPLAFHKHAALAAEAALAAAAQGRFWRYHDRLMANQRSLEPADLEAHAAAVRLDVKTFREALRTGHYRAAVEADKALAERLGVQATPTSFVNGIKVSGALPEASFRELVDRELAEMSHGQADYAERVRRNFDASGKAWQPRPERSWPAKPADAPAEQPPQPAEAGPVRIDIGEAPTRGPDNARIVVVMFADFQCPFSARAANTLRELERLRPHQVRIVFKNLPLAFHKDAKLAAEAALAAHAQGRFWAYHDRLFENTRRLTPLDLEQYAAELGLDVPQFRDTLMEGVYRSDVQADMAQAKRLGVTGTPTFFVNGYRFVGAQPVERFLEFIDQLPEP